MTHHPSLKHGVLSWKELTKAKFWLRHHESSRPKGSEEFLAVDTILRGGEKLSRGVQEQIINMKPEAIANILHEQLNWSLTPQGFDFWRSVYFDLYNTDWDILVSKGRETPMTHHPALSNGVFSWNQLNEVKYWIICRDDQKRWEKESLAIHEILFSSKSVAASLSGTLSGVLDIKQTKNMNPKDVAAILQKNLIWHQTPQGPRFWDDFCRELREAAEWWDWPLHKAPVSVLMTCQQSISHPTDTSVEEIQTYQANKWYHTDRMFGRKWPLNRPTLHAEIPTWSIIERTYR